MKEPMITLPKWKADCLLKEMDDVLKSSGQAVASASIASDHPDSANCINFMLKDVARCYAVVSGFMEQLRTDLDTEREAEQAV